MEEKVDDNFIFRNNVFEVAVSKCYTSLKINTYDGFQIFNLNINAI